MGSLHTKGTHKHLNHGDVDNCVGSSALHRSHVWPVLPQPVVTHLVPEGILVVEEARHTGDTRVFICTGEDSFRRVMSLLKFWEL